MHEDPNTYIKLVEVDPSHQERHDGRHGCFKKNTDGRTVFASFFVGETKLKKNVSPYICKINIYFFQGLKHERMNLNCIDNF